MMRLSTFRRAGGSFLTNPVDPLAPFRSGSTEPWVVDVICAIVQAQKPSVIVETGTYLGLTTYRLIRATQTYAAEKTAQVYSVEFDPQRATEALERLRATECNCTIIQGDAIQFLQGFVGHADLIFLDDDHTASHVREEIKLARKILRPGGILLLHDVVGNFGLGELVKEHGGVILDFPRLHTAGGLGVIVR